MASLQQSSATAHPDLVANKLWPKLRLRYCGNMAELTKSFIDLTDPNMTMPEDKDLFSLFKRVQKAGRVTEFVNLQTDERVDSNYILQQVSDIDSDLVNINAQHFL